MQVHPPTTNHTRCQFLVLFNVGSRRVTSIQLHVLSLLFDSTNGNKRSTLHSNNWMFSLFMVHVQNLNLNRSLSCFPFMLSSGKLLNPGGCNIKLCNQLLFSNQLQKCCWANHGYCYTRDMMKHDLWLAELQFCNWLLNSNWLQSFMLHPPGKALPHQCGGERKSYPVSNGIKKLEECHIVENPKTIIWCVHTLVTLPQTSLKIQNLCIRLGFGWHLKNSFEKNN